MNNDGREYVIPLISGKDKHKTWADVTASWYRIYEVIDITEDPVRPYDVIVEIKNQDILRKIDKDKQKDYRQRILSVLDLRKMFPVDESVYQKVKFDISSGMARSDSQRTFLMIKEYNFLTEITEEIAKESYKDIR